MKKLMIVAAAAFGLAAFGDIESSNTVGYMSKDLSKGVFTILGVQFESVEGDMDINKLITGLTGVDYDEDGDFTKTAPHIQVPNAGGGYDLYYYLNDGYYINEKGEEDYKPGWCDSLGTIAGNTEAGALVSGVLTPGVAIWTKSIGLDEPVTQAGQVTNTDELGVECPTVFALRAHMLPIGFNLNDETKVAFEGLKGADYDENGDFTKTAPHIQVPNAGGGYDLYYYLNDGYYINEKGEEAYKPGWCDSLGTIAGDTEAGALVSGNILAGQGFWTKGVSGTFTIKFKK